MGAADRWAAIDDMVGNLIATGRIKEENRDAITAVVKKRESSMSTGIGFGIGIPHASTDLIADVVGALGRSRKGISFDALDNQPRASSKNISTPWPTSPNSFTSRNFARNWSKPRTRRPSGRSSSNTPRRIDGRHRPRGIVNYGLWIVK
jgi:hypothetical protein